MSLRILFEDNHLIAVHKPSGITVQDEPGKPVSLESLVKAYIKEKYHKPGDVFLGVIHRLDMPVSGVVLFARTSKALIRMNALFKQRKIEKIYEAVVVHAPVPPSARIEHWLLRDAAVNKTKAHVKPVPNAEEAQLTYHFKGKTRQGALLRIELHTGRKHQIRAQLSAIGCPIVGDVKYGAPTSLKDGEILLRSSELHFIHPVSNTPIGIYDDPAL